MFHLIGYYQSPEPTKGWFGKESTTCLLNPQVYKEGVSEPIVNMGVIQVKFSSKPSQEELEARLTEEIKSRIGSGIQTRTIIISGESIQISLERTE